MWRKIGTDTDTDIERGINSGMGTLSVDEKGSQAENYGSRILILLVHGDESVSLVTALPYSLAISTTSPKRRTKSSQRLACRMDSTVPPFPPTKAASQKVRLPRPTAAEGCQRWQR